MTTIKIKTGLKSNLDSAGTTLGELKYTTDTNELFIGNGTQNKQIGGSGGTVEVDNTTIDKNTEGELEVKDQGITIEKINDYLKALSISSTPSDDKFITEKALANYIASGNSGKPKHISGVDLNTILATGLYSCDVCTNRPTENNGVMLVIKNSGTSDNAIQVYWTYQADAMWVRHKDLGTWKAWDKVLKSNDLPTIVYKGIYDEVEDKFYSDDTKTTELPTDEKAIYIDLSTSLAYQWNGEQYNQFGGSGSSSSDWEDITNKPFESLGTGLVKDSNNKLTYDEEVVSSVDYVDANITDTMNFIIQERNTEASARIAGDNLRYTKTESDEKYVQQVSGKGLSTNDYTTAEKTKLSGIAEGATKVEDNHSTTNGTIKVNGTETTVYDDTTIKEQLAGFNRNYVIDSEADITGTQDPVSKKWTNVSAIGDLDMTTLKVGDNIYIKDDTVPDYWITSAVSGIVGLNPLNTKTDLSNYYNKTQIDGFLGNKVDKTTTVNGKALSGNITLDKADISLGNVDNTSDATKKANFTGSIASGNTGFVTGGDVYSAIGNIETVLTTLTTGGGV